MPAKMRLLCLLGLALFVLCGSVVFRGKTNVVASVNPYGNCRLGVVCRAMLDAVPEPFSLTESGSMGNDKHWTISAQDIGPVLYLTSRGEIPTHQRVVLVVSAMPEPYELFVGQSVAVSACTKYHDSSFIIELVDDNGEIGVRIARTVWGNSRSSMVNVEFCDYGIMVSSWHGVLKPSMQIEYTDGTPTRIEWFFVRSKISDA